jgi:hypothetical protein
MGRRGKLFTLMALTEISGTDNGDLDYVGYGESKKQKD